MKKMILVFMAMAFLFSTSLALAGGSGHETPSVKVGVESTNLNKIESTNTNKNENLNKNTNTLKQDQDQRQKQSLENNINNQGSSAGASSLSGAEANNFLDLQFNSEDKREHTFSTPGVMGGFVAAPLTAPENGMEQIRCDSAYNGVLFTPEKINNMSKGGRFIDKRGSFWDAMTDIKVKPSVRVPFKGEPDDTPVKILDTVPMGAEVLGNFPCVGDYGWDLDEAIGKCIKRAKKETNTHFVIAWKGKETDNKNTGTSVGFGASIAVSPTVDGSGAGSAGALFGNSYAEKRTFWNVHIRAYSDVDLTKIPDVCTAPPMPPAPPVLKPPVAPPIPMPPPLPPAPPEKKCDAEKIRLEIRILIEEISKCKHWGIDNLRLRLSLGDAKSRLASCTGENGYLGDAIEEYRLAETNYRKGKDIKANQAEADRLIAQVYYGWAGCVQELFGYDAAIKFAREKNIKSIPEGMKK